MSEAMGKDARGRRGGATRDDVERRVDRSGTADASPGGRVP